MKLKLILTCAMLFALAQFCNETSFPEEKASGWDSVRSNWKGSETYGAGSAEANAAAEEYANANSGNQAYFIDHFQIVLSSVQVNSDGSQTWTYAMSKTSDGANAQDLSHFALIVPNCGSLNYVGLGGGSYGPDPSATSCNGGGDVVKWDRSVGSNETVYFSFTTDKAYAMGEITGIVKYSTQCASGTLPGPDCGHIDDGGTDPGDNCPDWVDTLQLTSSINYLNHHGMTAEGYPLYYMGETMYAAMTICNSTGNTATGLTVKTLEEYYPGAQFLIYGNAVHTWTGVTIAAHDCLTLNYNIYLHPLGTPGNYQTHLIVSRDADADCPTGALFVDLDTLGIWDPPANG